MTEWKVSPTKSMPEEHIGRCIELYGNPLDDEFKRTVPLASYEQMRADLMLAIGMLSVFATPTKQDGTP